MSEFDPYHKWLGIPETARPVSKYRLLAIEDFESDREVISAAAERQTIYLRTLQAGEHEVLVAQLLNEVSRARATLLNVDQKAEYDEKLRKQQIPDPEPKPTPIPVVQTPKTPPVTVVRPESEPTPASIPVVQTSPPLQSTPPQYFVSAKHLDEAAENELELVPLEVNATSPSFASVAQKGNKRTGNLQNDLWKSTAIISICLVGVIGVLVLVISMMFSGDADPVVSNTPPVVSSPRIPSPVPEPRPTPPPQPEPEPEPHSAPEPQPAPATANTLPSSLQEGLVAYYPFNGNARDESGNGNHGEINGSTASVDRHGRQESAYHFDKAGDCISQTSDSETPTGLSDCTICLWVYPEKLIKHAHVLLANGVTDDYQLALDYSDTPTSRPIELIVGSIRYKSQTMAWELNTWYHLIVVRNQGRLLFFRDGEDIGGAEGTARNRATDGNRALIFAARGTAGHQWHGKLDDIRIYNRALSEAEVKSLYEYETTSPNQPNPTPPLPPEPAPGTAESIPGNLQKGLFAYYPFNGNTKDESGQGHHASHYSSIPVKDRFGKENSAQRFRGQDHIEVPHSDEFNLQQQQGFTISLWINAFEGNGSNALVSKNNGGGDQDKWFLTLNDSKVLFHVNYGEGRSTNGTGDEGSYLINRTPSFNLNEWGHILISSDRQKLRFFSNGKLIWQQPVFGGPPSNNKAFIKIGMTEGANYYSGLMDDIRFYNRALSEAEVKALYDFEKP